MLLVVGLLLQSLSRQRSIISFKSLEQNSGIGEYLSKVIIIILSSHDLQNERWLIMSFKGMPECAKLIKKTTKGPNITFLIIRFFLTKLGRKIERSADHSLCKLITSQHFSNTKIPNFNFLVFVHKDIESLDISMQYFIFMNVL